MATYLETLEKLQQQSLDTLKQVQATQLAALTTIGELVSDVPAFRPASMANVPTFAELAELNASYTRNLLEQQNAFASQLAGIFTVTHKNVVNAAERAVQSAATAVK
ncbi:MAG: hypothetical protein NVS4B13_02870 [Candidatus Elarobacter sp.]